MLVWLTVLVHRGHTDPPRATLTVEPESPLFTGESVTLNCEIDTHDEWTYQWYKLDSWNGWTAVSRSQYHTVNGDTLTIRGDPVIDEDQYRCRGEIPDRQTSSQYSNSVTLTVEADLCNAKGIVGKWYSPDGVQNAVSFLKVWLSATSQYPLHKSNVDRTLAFPSLSTSSAAHGMGYGSKADAVLSFEKSTQKRRPLSFSGTWMTGLHHSLS
ncbi:hypothetical protein NFI96_009435 [Prochilodus magdalenae]|nr:hypothetical protein NFI96_009435 [Prochilodus magdalenae]